MVYVHANPALNEKESITESSAAAVFIFALMGVGRFDFTVLPFTTGMSNVNTQ